MQPKEVLIGLDMDLLHEEEESNGR